MMWLILTLVCLITLLVIFLIRHRQVTEAYKHAGKKKRVSVMIVMGSGGHTAEMLRMLSGLPEDNYQPRTYIIADTDTHSQQKVEMYEKQMKEVNYTVKRIPRSREVGQSYVTSVFTTLRSMITAFATVLKCQPDLVLSNGPGTAVPICFAAYFFSLFALCDSTVIYVESICRVQDLSLSAKLLKPFVNRLIVQWKELESKGEYHGLLSH